MKIIVGGAGNVGKSIVSYLSHGNNDIVVIDENEKNLNDLAKEWDVQPILGSVAHPDILKKAEAEKTDLIIAATDSDETNMIACQVAYSLFKVARKIARIDSRVYLKPVWGDLFGDKDMPVDLVVSPDYEIAQAITNVLKVPGMSGVYPLADNKMLLLSFRVPKKSPLVQIPLNHVERAAPDMKIEIISILRGGKVILPTDEDTLHIGDEIYLLVHAENLDIVIHEFGLEKGSNENVFLFGGNQIVRYIAEALESDDGIGSVKIIDEDRTSATELAEKLNKSSVFYGEMMSDTLLEEAGIANANAVAAVTLEDRDNIIATMIAKKNGIENTIALVNTRSYDARIVNIGENILIDRASITISSILKELRKVKLNIAYTLGVGFGEVWDIAIGNDSHLIGSHVAELKLPPNTKILATYHQNGNVSFISSKNVVKAGDNLILFVDTAAIKKAEKIFA